jgi:hypothetical protein
VLDESCSPPGRCTPGSGTTGALDVMARGTPIVSRTGGADVAFVGASWPLARFQASREEITLRLSILGLRYALRPEDVTRLEVWGSIPFFRQGIRIRHVNPDLPRRIIFWSVGGAQRLLNEIRQTGFVPAARTGDPRVGVPVRLLTVVAGILLWNAAFALTPTNAPPVSALLPLAVAFVVALAIPRSRRLQALVLRRDRHVGEIMPFLRLLTLVTGALLVIFIILTVGFNAV